MKGFLERIQHDPRHEGQASTGSDNGDTWSICRGAFRHPEAGELVLGLRRKTSSPPGLPGEPLQHEAASPARETSVWVMVASAPSRAPDPWRWKPSERSPAGSPFNREIV